METTLRRLAALTVLALLCSPVALAGDADEAEAVRLRDEMVQLSERSAWGGVEDAYGKLVATGTELTYDDHFLAAQAARTLGDVSAVRTRLLRANAASESQDVMDWLAAIGGQFGEVRLKSGAGEQLRIDKQPFASDQRAAVQFAADAIANKRAFSGYLPVGRYALGDQMFDVLPRMDVLVVDTTGPGKNRADQVAAATSEAETTPEEVGSGLQAAAVSDPSARSGGTELAVYGGAGTSYGWMGLGAIVRFGAVSARVAGGYDPVYAIPSGQIGLRTYPVSTIDLGPAALAPMIELAFAPLRWKEAGNALYGPALSCGAEFSIGAVSVDFQMGGGVTRDAVRGQTRPGLLTGVGLGYRFL